MFDFSIPNPPTLITLSFNNYVVLIKIFDCLIQSQRDVSRYSLLSNMSDFCPVLETFCEKVLSVIFNKDFLNKKILGIRIYE